MGSGFRTFQSGEVLTSSNVQNFLMDQSVMVFAGTAARGSAIASPETGMVSYRTDGTADSKREGFEFYDGASWARLVPATTTSGLELITSQTIGSAVSSVTVSNAFSSTYENYFITINSGAASAGCDLRLSLGATTTGYYWGFAFRTYLNVGGGDAASNGAFWPAGVGQPASLTMNCALFNPNLAKNTTFASYFAGAATTGASSQAGGYLADTTQYTAFTITPSSGTLTGGNIRVYGYKN